MIITREIASIAAAAVVASFGAVAWLEGEDAKQDAAMWQQTALEAQTALVAVEARLNTRISMNERARYAELHKYYLDKIKSGEMLTQAEQESFDLTTRMIHRIHAQLVEAP